MDADGLTLDVLAAAKGIPVEFMRDIGVTDGRWNHHPAVRISYRDERDREAGLQYRVALAGDRFRFPAGAKPIPYGIGRLATTNTPAWIYLVEGTSDCWTLWLHGLPAIGLPSATIWRDEWTSHLDGIALIYVIHEGDSGSDSLLGTLACSPLRSRIRVVRLPGVKDPSELYLADPDHFIERLAIAREGAVPLGDETAAVDTPPAYDTLAETLDAVESLLRRFVHFSDPSHPMAITLWIAFCHVWTQAETVIYLVLTSAVKQSGKTRTFDVLEQLVPSPWRAVRPSEAVVFRRIDRDHPTFMLDEYDTIFGDRGGQFEGLRSIFNSGNRGGTKVSRAVAKGKGFELVDFDIVCPKALAGLGALPDTITDRAIVVHLARRAPGDHLERLRSRTIRALAEPIRKALVHHLGRLDLTDAAPAIPDELGDRAADGWEPLIAVAEAAGGPWLERARAAAIALSTSGAADDDNWAIALLADLKTVFGELAVDRLWTGPLIDALVAIEESPWGDIRGKPLTAQFMAKLLHPFGIRPTQIRDGAAVRRGYLAADLADAWARYVREPSSADGRYSRYTRYADPPPSQGEHSAGGAGVTPVTPVADIPAKEAAAPPPQPTPGTAVEEQLTWTG